MVCAPMDPVYQHLIASGGGLLGGLSMMVYMRPSGLSEGVKRVTVSTVAGALLAGLLAQKAFGSETPELVAAAAFLIGFSAWSLLGAVAKFFENRQGDDIVEIVKSYKTVDDGSSHIEPSKPLPRKDQIDNPG